MRKLLLLLFIFPSFIFAQNVGVDVATPQQKLDVDGGIKIGNATTGVAGSLRWNGSNFQVHNGTQWITFGTGTDNDWTISGVDMYSQVSGNVGIGTTNPAYKLQVTGTSSLSSLNINGNYTLPTTDGGSGFVLTTDGSGNVTWSNPAAVGDITSVIAGDGLINGGTSGDVTLDVDPGDGIRIVSDQVAVRPTDLDNATNGLTVVSDDFAVNVDNSTLDINGDVLRVAPSGITSNEIADGTVTTDDIANGTVQSADIANGGVASVDILDGTIVPADIATAGNDQVLTTDGSGNPQWQNQNSLFSGQAGDGLVLDAPNTELDVNVDGSTIVVNSDVVEVPTGGITTTQILDETIGTADIATGGVTSDDIANGTVQSVDIANGGVASVDILDGTVAEADMESPGNDYVLTTDGSGNVSWVTQNSFNSAQAGDGLVDDGNQIDVNVDNSTIEINADILRVKAEGITANEIATGAVTTSEILDGTVLPADMDGPAAPNLVLSTNASNVVGWNDPASLTTTLEDRDSDTYISVDDGGSPDDDNIRFFNQTSESMTIDASGKVGIGTNTPERQVHVAGATGGQILATRADGNTNTGETLGELMFDSEDDTNPSSVDASALIRGIASEDHGNSNKGGHLAFLTKPNGSGGGAANATERMRITNTGNVGIGTMAPTAGLQVQKAGTSAVLRNTTNAGGTVIRFSDHAGGNYAQSGTLTYRHSDGQSYGYGNSFHLAGTEPSLMFRVEGNGSYAGSLGLGTTAPTQRLHVAGGARITDLSSGVVVSDANGVLSVSTDLDGTGWGDNLGNHSATQNLDMNGYRIDDFTRAISTNDATLPNIVLNSTSSGDNWSSQGAYISLGESGDLGAASLHMTYRGDGYGFIGSGAVSNAEPGASYFRFDYNSDNIYTPDNLTLRGQEYIQNNSPTIYLRDQDHRSGMIHQNGNLMYFLSANGNNSTTWSTNGSYWPLTLNMTNDEAVFGGTGLFPEGNVGIGTMSPTSNLTVHSGDATIRVGADTYNQTNSGRIIFEEDISASGANVCGFQFRHDGNANKLYLQSGCTPQTTRMTVQRDDGRVGIGTTTPSGLLHVNNTDNSDMYYTTSGNLYVNNPESFGGTVRLGAAWSKPGIYVNPNLYLNSEGSVIINDNNQENWRFDGDNLISNNWGRIYTTDNNFHLDAGPGDGIYLNWYAGSRVHIGRGNSSERALFDGNGLYLRDGWFRAPGNNGLYFQDRGTGIHSVQADGGNYGSVSTYGNVGGWEGYSMAGQFVWMTQGGRYAGLYNDIDNIWAILYDRLATNDGFRFFNSWSGALNMRIQHTNGGRYASYDGDSNWDFYSDRRLKKNIESERDILSRIMKLNVVNYDFIEPERTELEKQKGIVEYQRNLKEIGFIAQDVEEYFPSLVSESTDDRYDFKVKALGYSSFGVLAIGGIKELKLETDNEINSLKNTISELEGEVEKLKNLVNRLMEEKR